MFFENCMIAYSSGGEKCTSKCQECLSCEQTGDMDFIKMIERNVAARAIELVVADWR